MRMFLIWCVPYASSFLKHVCSHSQSDKKVTWLAEQNLLAVQNNHVASIQNRAASWFEMYPGDSGNENFQRFIANEA